MLKRKTNSERGQALVIVAFAIIGLVGIVGLAIDGGMAFSDRRHAQNAADTAALAGAMGIITPIVDPDTGVELSPYDSMQYQARARADSNGYFGDLVNSQVEVYLCSEADASCEEPYAGDPDYVQVIINSNVDTFFARVVGIPQMHNRVQAVARAKAHVNEPLYPGDSIIAISEGCQAPDNFIVEGGAQVKVTGGKLFVNTDNPACGFKCDTNNSYIQADIVTSGGTIDISDKCSANNTGERKVGGDKPLEFPVYLEDLGLEVPAECTGATGTYTNYGAGTLPAFLDPTDPAYPYPGYPTKPITILHPGRYTDFPPPKEQPLGKLNDIMILEPGVYCVETVLRWNQPSFTLIGHDVTLFVRSGYYFSLTGGTIRLDAPDSGDYQGYVMIVEPNYGDPPLSVNSENCNIDGAATNYYTGTILAPYCNITINGGSNPTGFNAQVIGYTIKMTGSSTINFTYDSGDLGTKKAPAETGITR